MVADAQIPALTQGAVDVIAEDELRRRLAAGRPLRVKLGIDPTASDIHLGFAVVLRKLRQFQDCGHVAVLILGDFTARVGDPSMRSATRPMLSSEEIDRHAASYIEQIGAILDPSPERLEVRRNSEWFAAMGMADVLRLAARTTVARMLERDDFAKRYSDGKAIAVSEFLYPLMQGWDSVMVRADVELGGTDQLFNLLVGRQLQEQEGQAPQVVLTTPLLVGLDAAADGSGNKMSKSLGNYVGIAEPADDQFGKLMSIPDALLPVYFQYATGWGQESIDDHTAALRSGELHPNAAKRAMARAVCDLYHGSGAGTRAEGHFDRVHRDHERPEEIAEVVLAPWAGEMRLSRVLQALGLAASGKEGARLIAQGGVAIDGERVAGDVAMKNSEIDGRVVQVGRRKWARVAIHSTPDPATPRHG
jgi:tyrosyl-tRNA synthetase